MRYTSSTRQGTLGINIIPEGDLYRLIIRSKLPAAEQFEEWVFDEVLPSIRKTGKYEIPKQSIDKDLEIKKTGSGNNESTN